MLTLYSMQGSGNCYKLRLALHQTGTPFRLQDVDILRGESHTPEFLAMNPNGKVPLLALDDGRYLPESNAGLYYLASGTPLLPDDLFLRAQVLQWMFFEQYSHEPYIAVARFWWSIHPEGRILKHDLFEGWRERGYQALDIMETHLAQHTYLVDERYTIADIALYAYTHVADEGTFDLASYPHINTWLERVRAEPNHIPMNWRPVENSA